MIAQRIKAIEPVDTKFHEIAQKRLDSLTKPIGSLGRLEEFALRLAGIKRSAMPEIGRKAIFTFAGDHGVARAGVSAYPAEVTPQMVLNFIRGGAAINVLARHAGADVVVVDMGVNYDFDEEMPGLVNRKVRKGTSNIAEGPAMSRPEAEQSIAAGFDLAVEYAAKGYGLLGTGDMGIGNTTPSSAIAACVTGKSVAEVTGRGAGLPGEAVPAKVKIIEQALAINKPDPRDGIDLLTKVGGFEIGGIAGLCLGAAASKTPVVVDGLISTAGALIAYLIEPRCIQYMFSAHRSVEIGHTSMLSHMGLDPMLDLKMRLGEGTGAALGMTLIEAGLKMYKEMATFADAGVSESDKDKGI